MFSVGWKMIKEYEEIIRRAWAKLDKDFMIKLTMELIDTWSPTGRERAVAEVLGKYLKAEGFEVDIQEIEEERANVIGIMRGSGDGPSLLLNGHLDTSFTGIEDEDYPMAGEISPGLKAKAYLQGNAIWGLGAMNMKGPLATLVAAVCAIRRAGIGLKGDVIIAGVAGEIEKAPIDALFKKYSGSYYRGSGIGMSYLLTHGYSADFALTAEPNGTVEYARPGFMFVQLIVKGRVAYGPTKWTGDNAILKMAKVIQAIEHEFADAYAEKYAFNLGEEWGVMKPTVNVGAIESGWPYKPGFIPGICAAYIDMRLVPGLSPLDALKELSSFLQEFEKKEKISVEIRPFVTKPGTMTEPNNYFVRSCRTAYEYVAGTSPPKFSFCFGDDTNVTRLFGIPSITWGPPAYGSAGHAIEGLPGEYINIDDMVTTAKMYVAAIVDICMQDRSLIVRR